MTEIAVSACLPLQDERGREHRPHAQLEICQTLLHFLHAGGQEDAVGCGGEPPRRRMHFGAQENQLHVARPPVPPRGRLLRLA